MCIFTLLYQTSGNGSQRTDNNNNDYTYTRESFCFFFHSRLCECMCVCVPGMHVCVRRTVWKPTCIDACVCEWMYSRLFFLLFISNATSTIGTNGALHIEDPCNTQPFSLSSEHSQCRCALFVWCACVHYYSAFIVYCTRSK